MREKIRIIFIPTLLTLLGLIVVYTFLHWILFIQFKIFPVKEMIIDFGIPVVLTGVASWIFLRPRFKVLRLEAKRGNWRDFYSFILWVILSIPLIIAQTYVITASGKLTELNSINEINTLEPTKYYTIKHYYIDKKRIGAHPSFDVSGKYGQDFNMRIYIAMPILESASDTLNSECLAWLGIDYYKRISSRLEPSEKEEKYKEFALSSQNDFNKKNVSEFSYLDRIENSDKREGLVEAIKKNKFREPSQTILCPVIEPFEARNGNKFAWIGGSAAIGLTIWFIMLSIPKIDNGQLERIKQGKPDRQAQREWIDFISILKPRENYFVTPILIWINIGLFILMVIAGLGFVSFKAQELLSWGANFRPITKGEREWWRLFTNIFLHGGLMHVLANMYGLMYVGMFLEPLLGKMKFLLVYLVTGIIASIASIWWYDATVSVGASGAIFGLYGFFLSAMVTRIYPAEFGKAFLISTAVFVGFNLLMGLVGGIDNAAHIGGLLSGLAIGLLSYPFFMQQTLDEEQNR